MRHFGLLHPGFCGSTALQVWKSEEGELFDTWVRSKEEVSSRLLAHLGIRATGVIVCALCVAVLFAQVASLGPLGVLGR
jgi:hypothetical protein